MSDMCQVLLSLVVWGRLSSKDGPWQLWMISYRYCISTRNPGENHDGFNMQPPAQFHFQHGILLLHTEVNQSLKEYLSFLNPARVRLVLKSHSCLPSVAGLLLTYWTGMHCAGLVNFPTLASLMCLWLATLLGFYPLSRSVHFYSSSLFLDKVKKKKKKEN